MSTRYDTIGEEARLRTVIVGEPCSCRRLELRVEVRSKRERDGTVHSRTYCGPDRRVNRARDPGPLSGADREQRRR